MVVFHLKVGLALLILQSPHYCRLRASGSCSLCVIHLLFVTENNSFHMGG